jgi:murein DD-endopeptidase MepM/ murein hydrolase activator NlpD
MFEAILGATQIKILIVPDKGRAVKQVSTSLPFIAIGMFVLFSLVACSCWLLRDYKRLSDQVPQLAEMEKENGQKEGEIVHLRERMNELDGDFKELLALDQKLRTVANVEASQPEVGMLAMGGSDLNSTQPGRIEVHSGKGPISALDRDDAATEGKVTQLTRGNNPSVDYPKHHQVLFASLAPIQPANGFIMNAFGTRLSPGSRESEFHRGIDISTRLGAPVLATSDGVIASIASERGYGRTLSINHADGLATFYSNLGEILVREGEFVKRGSIIAAVGKGGLDGSHLHYEVRIDGIPVDPAQFTSTPPHMIQSSVSP